MHSMERVYLEILWKELICLIKVILYHPGQYGVFSDDTYHVCEDVYARFEMLVGNEEFPFRDEASIAFLKKRNCSFIEGDRYAIRDGADIDRVFPITYINRCEQEGLILISNSQKGIYTHTKHLDRLVINALKKLDIDILLAVCVDEDYVYGILSAVKDFEAVNFDYDENLFTFCRKFEYDWKRDLPDIARLIDMKYPEGCEIILTYREWFEAGVICDKKIFAKTLLKEKLRSRRLAIMLIDFMKDESVRLSKINSTKNPDTRLLFDDLPSVADDVKRTFYLIIDIDETIRSERDIVDYCIYGGWINKEFVEVLGKEEVLPIFEDLIPDILRREMILCG